MSSTRVRFLVSLSIAAVIFAGPGTVRSIAASQRPGALIDYRIERLAEDGRELDTRFTRSQLAILEKLNRANLARLRRLDQLVVPLVWHDDDLRYSPFPSRYPAAAGIPKLLVIDQPAQAFAAYEAGRLARWGPVSSGRRAHPTPSGLFRVNWRSPGRRSTINPAWYMKWYVNFDSARGLALHLYTLPGYPASRACIRLLEHDAIWIYEWGDVWTLDARGQIVEHGTPLLIVGQYAFDAPPLWRSLEQLTRGIDLPEAPLPNPVRSLLENTSGPIAAGGRADRCAP